jgi:putative ABC transport system substrate-binding protein
MRRREFITLIGGAATTWPVAARAAPTIRRVGVLMGGPATDALQQSMVQAFVQGLKQLGWNEGQNVHIDIRWNNGFDLAKIYAAQVVGFQPDVVFVDTTPNLVALREATSNIPIIFIRVSDPVEQGFVTNVTKPGGNMTGFSGYDFSTGGKWLDLLKQTFPQLARAGIVFNPETSPQSKFFIRAIEAAGSSLGVQSITLPVRAATDIEPILEGFARDLNGGVILPTGLRPQEKLIADMTLRLRLPSISFDSEFPKMGGLMSYSADVNWVEDCRQAAGYVDRILRGAKAGELPIQRPDRYKVVINLKTAKALALAVPLSLTVLADEVIE